MSKLKDSYDIFIDPVCLRLVAPHIADFNYTYQLKTYYFCDHACREAFMLNPATYLDKYKITEKRQQCPTK